MRGCGCLHWSLVRATEQLHQIVEVLAVLDCHWSLLERMRSECESFAVGFMLTTAFINVDLPLLCGPVMATT